MLIWKGLCKDIGWFHLCPYLVVMSSLSRGGLFVVDKDLSYINTSEKGDLINMFAYKGSILDNENFPLWAFCWIIYRSLSMHACGRRPNY
jgi:hypothetical protein